MTFGEKIKKFRKNTGLSQNQLAQMCDLAEITIRQYETNKRQPDLIRLKKISEVLGISLSDFLESDLFDAATLPDIDEEKTLECKIKKIIDNKKITDQEKRLQLQELKTQMEIMQNIHERNIQKTLSFNKEDPYNIAVNKFHTGEALTTNEVVLIKDFWNSDKFQKQIEKFPTLINKLANTLEEYCELLNENGLQKAEEQINHALAQIELLTKIPEYRKNADPEE